MSPNDLVRRATWSRHHVRLFEAILPHRGLPGGIEIHSTHTAWSRNFRWRQLVVANCEHNPPRFGTTRRSSNHLHIGLAWPLLDHVLVDSQSPVEIWWSCSWHACPRQRRYGFAYRSGLGHRNGHSGHKRTHQLRDLHHSLIGSIWMGCHIRVWIMRSNHYKQIGSFAKLASRRQFVKHLSACKAHFRHDSQRAGA